MDALNYLQYASALIFVVALIGVAAMLARRFGLGRALPAAARRRRLAVCEVLPLDAKRRLVLLRRDGTEHLVILGPAGETVVEAGITACAAGDTGFLAALRAQTVDAAP